MQKMWGKKYWQYINCGMPGLVLFKLANKYLSQGEGLMKMSIQCTDVVNKMQMLCLESLGRELKVKCQCKNL